MDLAPGDRLDGYSLGELVAKTVTASVFKATDLDTGGTVALKIPHLQSEADLVFFERFQREAAIGRELDHPAVTKVLPEQHQSRIYIVMEWVDGPTLRSLLEQEGKIPKQRAVRIAIKLCEALAYIHGQGVVHRDLKPENIVLGTGDSVKLLDFGIAAKRDVRRLTFGKWSSIMGTPDYISPEQVRGKRGDARSDIFSAGVILYEMLTGQLPFRGDNPLALINDRLLNEPVSPSHADPEFDPALAEVVQRAMSRDPDGRYSTAREMALDLEHPEKASPLECHGHNRPETLKRRLVVICSLAMIPTFIFLVLLYIARQQ